MGTAIDIIRDGALQKEKREAMESIRELKRYTVDERVRDEFGITFGKTIAFLDMIGIRDELEDILGDIEVADSPAKVSKLKGKLDLIMKYVGVFKAASDSVNRVEKTIIKEKEEITDTGEIEKIEVIEKIDYDTIAREVKR